MPNQIIGFFSTAKTWNKFDFTSNTWSLVANSIAPFTANGASQACAWDGFYYYQFAASGELARIDINTGSVVMRANGAKANANNRFQSNASAVSDGSVVWFLEFDDFGYYNPATDSFTYLAYPSMIPKTASAIFRLTWDYGDYLYAVGRTNVAGSSYCAKYRISTGTWSAEVAPPDSSSSTSGQNTWYSNGRLYVFTGFPQGVVSAPMPGGSWTVDTTSFTAAGNVLEVAAPIDSDRIVVTYWGTYSPSTKTAASFTSPGGSPGAMVGCAYTLPINPLFLFLEADGVTAQISPEPVGGSTARLYAGLQTGAYPFALKCLAPRTVVTLSIQANAASDLSGAIEISSSPTGPWAQTASLGAFNAGQVKPYYLRATTPSTITPGLKNHIILATAT